jgi:DNA-binding XRE family transcriptional regulator
VAVARSLAAYKLEQYRTGRALTKAALARELGVSEVAVFFWERGQRVPRYDMIGKLNELGICSPNEWHEPAPDEDSDRNQSAA